MPVTDEELVCLAKAGDEKAFEELVIRYEKKVYATAFRFLRNEHDVMDASQEVFIRVYRFLEKFSGKSSFSTWVYRITANVCKDALKKRRGQAAVSLDDTVDEDENYSLEIADRRYDPAEAFDRAELGKVIQDGINSLPDDYKEILIMREIYDMSYEQIASTLEIEIGTVKSRISRGRERLRKYLLKIGNKPLQNGNKSDPFQSNK